MGARALEGDLLEGPTRGPVESLGFDIDALPVATWGRPDKGTGFYIAWDQNQNRYQLSLQGSVFAEVVIGDSFAAFTGGPFWAGTPPKCRKTTEATTIARWTGFSSFEADTMDVQMGDGEIHLSTCEATPSASLSAKAKALVPGYVYAVRTHRSDEANDTLVVLMPRGRLVSAAGDPGVPLNASDSGAFTRLSFPLDPRAAGQASVRLSVASLKLWEGLRKQHEVSKFEDATRSDRDLTVDVNVICQGDTRVGSVAFAVPAEPESAKPYAPFIAAARSKM